jgi:hypothetical protein
MGAAPQTVVAVGGAYWRFAPSGSTTDNYLEGILFRQEL